MRKTIRICPIKDKEIYELLDNTKDASKAIKHYMLRGMQNVSDASLAVRHFNESAPIQSCMSDKNNAVIEKNTESLSDLNKFGTVSVDTNVSDTNKVLDDTFVMQSSDTGMQSDRSSISHTLNEQSQTPIAKTFKEHKLGLSESMPKNEPPKNELLKGFESNIFGNF